MMSRKGILYAITGLLLWGVGIVGAQAAPWQTASSVQTTPVTAPKAGGVVTPQMKKCSPGDPTCYPIGAEGTISASPNPCHVAVGGNTCTVVINWTSNRSDVEVWVSGISGGTASLFASGESGSQAASWMWVTSPGYVFTLKSGSVVLGSIEVHAAPPEPVQASSVHYSYDELGRVLTVSDSAGHVQASYQYDANGNVTKVTDALNNATTLTYDALDRVSQVTDALGHVTTYQYDQGGQLSQVTDPRGNATVYTYDGFGQLWEQTSPDTGTTTYAYDPYGQLTGMNRASGVLTTYTYDGINRLTGIATGTQTRHISYDSCTNGIGRVCSVSDATGTTAYAYDAQGDITSRTFTMGSTSYALGYSYDGSGRIAAVTYPDGNQATYHYYPTGRLANITATVGGVGKVVVNAITYRGGDRQLASWTAGNGLVNTYSYDADGRLTGIAVPNVQSLDFTYGAAGRITAITNGIHAPWSQTFTYDAVGRLTQIASPAGNQSFAYDANGNRTEHTVDGVTTPSVIEPTSNRLASVGGQAIGYDANGNVVSKGGATVYHYDSFNRLESAGGATFTINPEGQRLRKTGPDGTTYFAPDRSGQLLADDQQGTWKDYVWMGGRMVGMLTGGQVYALHSDQTGRVLAITGPSGAVAWEAEGLAFDRDTATGSGAFFRLGFPGQYWDEEDSLWHNGYRDYDPTLGRYIESDPSGLAGGLNTYVYVGGNPLSYIDPYGLGWLDPLWHAVYWATGGWSPSQGTVDFAAGMGDTLSLGLTDMARNAMGTNDVVDKCSGSYLGGEIAGAALDIGIGGAAGLEAAGERGAGREFSHWIPNRMGGPRSLWNGNYVSTETHALSDPFRYRFMPRSWKAENPMGSRVLQQLIRIPNALKGLAAGAAAGAAGSASGSGCGCHQ